MNKNNPYYHEKIKAIPHGNIRTLVETELRDLSFDLGKRVQSGDPEFDYMVGRVQKTLIENYPEWEMQYFDSCMKNGMLDEYDKGQTLTVKRLLVWMSCFDNKIRNSVFNRPDEKKETLSNKGSDGELFSDKCSRHVAIINFRVMRKPEYDADKWTPEEIEKTAAFQEWKKNRSGAGMSGLNLKIGRAIV